jgi:hypothetical protein
MKLKSLQIFSGDVTVRGVRHPDAVRPFGIIFFGWTRNERAVGRDGIFFFFSPVRWVLY